MFCVESGIFIILFLREIRVLCRECHIYHLVIYHLVLGVSFYPCCHEEK